MSSCLNLLQSRTKGFLSSARSHVHMIKIIYAFKWNSPAAYGEFGYHVIQLVSPQAALIKVLFNYITSIYFFNEF